MNKITMHILYCTKVKLQSHETNTIGILHIKPLLLYNNSFSLPSIIYIILTLPYRITANKKILAI